MIGVDTPRWSRWAEKTTCSSLSRRSLPGSRATTLEEVTGLWRVATVARSDRFMSNPGSGFEASARSETCAKVRPERANSFSLDSVLTLAAKNGVFTSRSAGSAKYMPDWPACAIERDQGTSTAFAVVSEIRPTAPLSDSSRARSRRACALSAPEISAGPPLITTAIFPLRSTPAKSSWPASGMWSP